MTKVYLLQHSYEYGEDNEHTETKLLGIFSSKSKAEEAVEFYKNLPVFKDFDESCFYIGEHELNKYEWIEGCIDIGELQSGDDF